MSSLVLLVSTLALADKPAAVQLCFSLPPGVSLYADAPRLNYRAIAPDTYLLDGELRLDGQAPERLTRDGADCLRAWVPARHVGALTMSFERTTLSLAALEKKLDLKLKPDLWYSGGRFAVERAPWVRVSTGLPGKLTLERQGAAGVVLITELEQVPAGTYRVQYAAPALPTSPCSITVNAIGVGTIRADNRPEQFTALVEQYSRDWLPEVVKHQKLACSELETLQVEVRIFDGVFTSPNDPAVRRVSVPARQPRYALVIDGAPVRFESGGRYTFTAGQQVLLEQLAPGATLAAVP